MEQDPTLVRVLAGLVVALVGVLLWIVRRIVRGQLVPDRYLDQERERANSFQAANEKLTEVLREVLVDKDLGLHMLTSLRAQSHAQEGDSP